MTTEPTVYQRQRAARDAQYVQHDAHKRSKHRHLKVAACDACAVEVKIACYEWSRRYFPEAGIPRALR